MNFRYKRFVWLGLGLLTGLLCGILVTRKENRFIQPPESNHHSLGMQMPGQTKVRYAEESASGAVTMEELKDIHQPITPASVAKLATPSPRERPYIRLQINPDGSVSGLFGTKCQPVKQARYLRSELGYYYRVVSPDTGETLIDGVVAKPILRQPHNKIDHGISYTSCTVTVLENQPVFFDVPNVAGRLEVYATTPASTLATATLPLIKAVDLSPP